MMNRIVRKLIDTSVSYEIIEETDRDSYTVAISSLIFSFLTWGTLISLGILCGEVYGSLLFLLFHIPLRVYAGGFHQNTRGKCYVQSLIIFLLLMLGSADMIRDWIAGVWVVFVIPSYIVIWHLAPVEASNKPLNMKERMHHRKAARIILTIEAAALVLFEFNHSNSSSYYSVMSVLLVSVQLIFGLIDRRAVRGGGSAGLS